MSSPHQAPSLLQWPVSPTRTIPSSLALSFSENALPYSSEAGVLHLPIQHSQFQPLLRPPPRRPLLRPLLPRFPHHHRLPLLQLRTLTVSLVSMRKTISPANAPVVQRSVANVAGQAATRSHWVTLAVSPTSLLTPSPVIPLCHHAFPPAIFRNLPRPVPRLDLLAARLLVPHQVLQVLVPQKLRSPAPAP